MKQLYFSLSLLSGLLFTGCSNKDDSPAPANPIAANTAAAKVDGVAFPVVMKNTVAVLNSQTGALFVNIGTTDVRGVGIYFELVEFRKKPAQFELTGSSPSNITLRGEYLNSPDGEFSTDRCSTNKRTFRITEFNEKARTVSGTFSATVCSTNGKTKAISDGEFNLPYIIQ